MPRPALVPRPPPTRTAQHDARRRAVCTGLAAGLVAAGPATATTGSGLPQSAAMARLGARLAADLPPAALDALRRLAARLHGLETDALRARIAADFRAGRTVTLRGIALSHSEAALFVAAQDPGVARGGQA